MRSWVDQFVPAALRADDDTLRRARLTVLLSTVLTGTAVAYALFYALAVGFTAGALILCTGAAASLVGLAVLRAGRGIREIGQSMTCVIYAVLVALVCDMGGLRAPVTPWLVIPPMFAALLLGRRTAVGVTALCALTIAALYAVENAGFSFPVGYDPSWTTTIAFMSLAGLIVSSAILLWVFEDIREETQARAETATAALAELAYQDALTGLANRAHFVSCLDAALLRAGAAGELSHVAVFLLDLDRFKDVNDSLGHAAGDAVLVQVAARLLSATRGSDTVARLGGDEFAVLLVGVREDAAAVLVAERVVAALAEPIEVGGREVVVGASLGIARVRAAVAASPDLRPASYDGAPRGDVAAILHDADVAMYRAKSLGGGGWVHFGAAAPAEDGRLSVVGG